MKKLLFVCALATLLGACQKDRNNDPVKNVSEASKDKDLQGKVFESECSINIIEGAATGVATGGDAAMKGQRVAYLVSGANVTRTTRYHVAADCKDTAALTFEEKGTVTIDKNQKTNDGGYNIELDYNTLEVKIATDKGQEAAIAVELCGTKDWAVNQTRNVTDQAKDLKCYRAQVPRHVSNIYRVDANVLYLGTQTRASVNKDARPKALDMGTKFVAR